MKREPIILTEKIRSFTHSDREQILKAFDLCGDRAAGTASVLIDLGLDADAVIAALVLGGFPDRALPEAVETRFGTTVAQLVNGAAKIERIPVANKTIREAQNIRNMIFALTDDIRVLIIKLAEKLQALHTFDSSPDDERKDLARECLDIYAPLADRLGIFWLKDDLEDLSLKFINREAYQQIKNLVSQRRDQRGEFLERAQGAIKAEAEAAGINVDVKSRAKHFYSIYMKMRRRGKGANEIFDLSGIRIICDSIENCYTLLGVVHRLWAPVKGEFDDYIANPKPNGYQSLHTSVMIDADGEERRLEIQIRTREMHQLAENGVASHWLYKKGSSRDMVQAEDIGVVNRLKEWKKSEQTQDGAAGSGEFSGSWLEEIKREIFHNSIYVLTPQGRVINLPSGATPIDFAYHVHTGVGERCIGAKVNGSIVPLSSELKSTQVVEILTSSSARPHLGWLETAKTSKARSKIRAWIEQNDSPHSVEKAEKLAEKKKPTIEIPIAPSASEKDGAIMQRVLQPLKSVLQVRIEDEKNLLIHFARCCNPVTGDAIVGYVSRGRGIIIHRENCPNLANNPELENRKINASWEHISSGLVKRFRIDARETANLFSEIEGAIRRRQGHLIEGRLEEVPAARSGGNRLTGFFTIQLAQADDLKAAMKNIRGIPGILGIQLLN
ncbi:MAG: HD domain-containing protein [Treponema sp.]|nr:HD domain-containing protein [Treponema sp.]